MRRIDRKRVSVVHSPARYFVARSASDDLNSSKLDTSFGIPCTSTGAAIDLNLQCR